MPEVAVTVVANYPTLAREAGVDGTVVLFALVCEHGRVVDVRVYKSIPMLDAAAVEAVKRWTFKPALAGGRNVACWTEVPVRFLAH
ncbi:MAG TPA: energy transducer TonB [Candidatus Eisenbacteria bacterium]